jgi:predicted RND superfamily exporter protein
VRGTGPAIIATTAVLVAGFLSMLTSGLVAIRDMGLVATVALTGALLADLILLPALLATGAALRGSASVRALLIGKLPR